jgi:hypothetical protein
MWGLLPTEGENWEALQLFETSFTLSSFGEDVEGEIYVVDYGGGIYRLTATK